MATNRIAHLFETVTETQNHAPDSPPGFVALPVRSLADLSAQLSDLQAQYEMAYLLARAGYVIDAD
ncbi:MAG: hypothetical protein ACKVT0_17365 [Planctomycetaceae bacterium]